MPHGRFSRDVFIPDLGSAAGYAVLGFRASARGQERCGAVARSFEAAFGVYAEDAISGLQSFARILGRGGRRRVGLALPGCARVMPDEISFLCAVSAAQRGEADEQNAHLRWLFAAEPAPAAALALKRAAAAFAASGKVFSIRTYAPTPRADAGRLHAVSTVRT